MARQRLSITSLFIYAQSSNKLQANYINIYYELGVPLDSDVEEVASWMGIFLTREGFYKLWLIFKLG